MGATGELGEQKDAALAQVERATGPLDIPPERDEGFAKAEVTVGGIATDGLSSQPWKRAGCPASTRLAKRWTSRAGLAAIISNGPGAASRRARRYERDRVAASASSGQLSATAVQPPSNPISLCWLKAACPVSCTGAVVRTVSIGRQFRKS